MNNFVEDFLKLEPTNEPPQKGKILISEPFAHDIYFKRSVVLLTEHNPEGTVGFILNKPVDIDLPDLLGDFPDIEANVSLGGPVGRDTIHFIHTLGPLVPESVEVLPGLWWGGSFDALRLLAESEMLHSQNVRFFIGYSGWHDGQLAGEIERQHWIVTRTDCQSVMAEDVDKIWQKALRDLGDKYRAWGNFPENPNLN